MSDGWTLQTEPCLGDISGDAWNALVDPDFPFLRHEFLGALERNDCLEPNGWHPCHLVLRQDDALRGALPLYAKTNSVGEFVFDYSWADAYERSGRAYYPKLVNAIPFVPATGPRLLRPDKDAEADRALAKGLVAVADQMQVSSLHCLFPNDAHREEFERAPMLTRMGCQYHWFNNGYRDFADFLDRLNSKRRKQIRRERRDVVEAGIEVEILDGNAADAATWEVFYRFYCSTFHRKWGEPRYTLEFFLDLAASMPNETLLFMARHGGRYVAGAFAMRGAKTLFGRHWGCDAQFRHLHFELCYYQTIDYCIRSGIERLDAGAQGEHKVQRGFVPVRTYSTHWLRDGDFSKAVEDFLVAETDAIERYIADVSAHVPYKCANP